MSEWQPIETAPKDGTMVLLYGYFSSEFNKPNTHRTGPHVGFFDGDKDEDGEDLWRLEEGVYYDVCWCTPTHWMPLPEPPEGER